MKKLITLRSFINRIQDKYRSIKTNYLCGIIADKHIRLQFSS